MEKAKDRVDKGLKLKKRSNILDEIISCQRSVKDKGGLSFEKGHNSKANIPEMKKEKDSTEDSKRIKDERQKFDDRFIKVSNQKKGFKGSPPK